MTATLQFPRSSVPASAWPLPPIGFESGFSTEADALPRITHTADGTDVNDVWRQFKEALDAWNSRVSSLAGLLSYWHTNAADAIPASFTQNMFERASEFGEPVAMRPGSYRLVGYDFEDWDTATRFTWKALRDMDTRQVRAAHNEALSADSRLLSRVILERLFDPTQGVNDQGTAVYGLFNSDGMEPAPFAGQTFPGSHTHYLRSGNASIDSGDVEGAIRHVREHGYGVPESGQMILLLVNPNQADVVMSWKKGAENANSAIAKWDALPSVGAPAFEIPGQIVGQQAPAELFNVPVTGSYGPALVVESYFIPNNYFAVVASSGGNSPNNLIGVREHANPAYRGLRMIPGPVPGHPLQESFYTRGFGVGVRQRGGAVVTQVTTNPAYTRPVVSV